MSFAVAAVSALLVVTVGANSSAVVESSANFVVEPPSVARVPQERGGKNRRASGDAVFTSGYPTNDADYQAPGVVEVRFTTTKTSSEQLKLQLWDDISVLPDQYEATWSFQSTWTDCASGCTFRPWIGKNIPIDKNYYWCLVDATDTSCSNSPESVRFNTYSNLCWEQNANGCSTCAAYSNCGWWATSNSQLEGCYFGTTSRPADFTGTPWYGTSGACPPPPPPPPVGTCPGNDVYAINSKCYDTTGCTGGFTLGTTCQCNGGGTCPECTCQGAPPPVTCTQSPAAVTFASAYTMSLSGTAVLTGSQSITMCDGSEPVWYKFDAQAGDTYDITATFTNADIDLRLTDSSGTGIKVATSVTDNEQMQGTISTTGTYYVEVKQYSVASSTGVSASLAITLTRGSCTASPTPNDHASAISMSLTGSTVRTGSATLTMCGNGADVYFQFPAGAGAYVITATFTDADGDVDISLRDSSDQQLAASRGSTDNEQMTGSFAQAGTYYVRVTPYQGVVASGVSVTLSVSVVPGSSGTATTTSSGTTTLPVGLVVLAMMALCAVVSERAGGQH
jgi:Bacterial pre-peptidase C-terminal domain